MKTILRKGKFPFNVQSSAEAQASRLHLKEFKIVPYETGFAIETEEEVRPDEGADTKVAATTPWKPASYVDIPQHLRQPGYRYRACNKDKPGNIVKKIAEGWEIDTELSKKMRKVPTVQDGAPIDGTYQVRELIIMRIPEERAQARDKYYADLATRNRAGVKQKFNSEVSALNDGAGSYGESVEVLQ